MRYRLGLLSALLLLSAGSAFAQAGTIITNQWVPFDFQITSCTGEIVTFIGEAHVIQQATGNPNGAHSLVHINFQLEGTSASGTKYVVSEQLNGIEVSGGGFVFQNDGHLQAISQGSEDNLFVSTTIHFTVNANGEVTADQFEFTTECTG
ncbi:MAG: hypothetical protein ACLGH0_09120 [Thermoanaerobaculia bacterium]